MDVREKRLLFSLWNNKNNCTMIPVHVGVPVVSLLLESVREMGSNSNGEGKFCSSVSVHVGRWSNQSVKNCGSSRITQIATIVDSKLLFKWCKRQHITREWKTAVEWIQLKIISC